MTHDFDAWVVDQPRGERRGLPVRQDVDRPMRGHVDQDRVVGMATANRKIVDTKHRHRRDLGHRLRADHPDEQVTAARHPDPGGQPGTGPADQRERDRHQGVGQHRRAPGEWRRQARDLLAERRP